MKDLFDYIVLWTLCSMGGGAILVGFAILIFGEPVEPPRIEDIDNFAGTCISMCKATEQCVSSCLYLQDQINLVDTTGSN